MSLAIDVLEPSALLIVCQVLDGALLTRLRGVKPGIGGAVNVRFCLLANLWQIIPAGRIRWRQMTPPHCIGRWPGLSSHVDRRSRLPVNGVHHRHQAFRSAIIWRLLNSNVEEILRRLRSPSLSDIYTHAPR